VSHRTAASSERGARAGFIVAGAACFLCIGTGSLGSNAACGGRVDGETGSSGSSSASGTSGGATSTPGQKPPGTGRPPRSPAGPLTNAAVASAIAEDYCKTFSSCCVGAGQPPIDVARCRTLTSASVEKQLDTAGKSGSNAQDVAVCVDAIHARVATCSVNDVRWHGTGFPLIAPGTVATVCEPLLPNVTIAPFERCSKSMQCQATEICAIDVCSASGLLGFECTARECLDGANCVGGKCIAASLAGAGASCATDIDCRVGLVCFEHACAPTREHPELAKQRSSPYRIDADTCSAYNYL
jgi:hypothetical protein